jgi:hypothetical protein
MAESVCLLSIFGGERKICKSIVFSDLEKVVGDIKDLSQQRQNAENCNFNDFIPNPDFKKKQFGGV